MDIAEIQAALADFINTHRVQFDRAVTRQPQLLELGALAIAAEHYSRQGYTVTPSNIIGDTFKVKTGARGHPINFSWFECRKGTQSVEIHANLPVASSYAQDDGVYVVDVGVSAAGKLPDRKHAKEWRALDNKDLITFIEAKHIVVYPMLLAQFVGIVHEIKPRFLGRGRPQGFKRDGHFDPALVSIGYLHALARGIIRGYVQRKYHVKVIPSFDTEIARLRGSGEHSSPLS